jgi:hypothetical protein
MGHQTKAKGKMLKNNYSKILSAFMKQRTYPTKAIFPRQASTIDTALRHRYLNKQLTLRGSP